MDTLRVFFCLGSSIRSDPQYRTVLLEDAASGEIENFELSYWIINDENAVA